MLAPVLFLNCPAEDDGGELVAEDPCAAHAASPAGDVIQYQATSLHRVNHVSRGVRFGFLVRPGRSKV